MADDPTLFGLHKLHLVKMSIANECMCVGSGTHHMHVRDLVSVGVCVYPCLKVYKCVCICTFGCVNRM